MKNPKSSEGQSSRSLNSPASSLECLLSRKDVASLLSVHPETVKRMGKRGELTEVMIRRNIIRYRPDQVNALMQNAS